MTTSRVPAVIDALVSLLTSTLTGVDVNDGRWVTVPASTRSYLTVGWTPTGEVPTSEQSRSDIGGNDWRDERITVPCYIDCYSGSTDMAPRRTAAYAVQALVETALRSDRTLGGVVTPPGTAEFASSRLYAEQTDQGLEVGIVCVIAVTTLLT